MSESQATQYPEGLRVHRLKTWPDHFQAIVRGSKRFELRKNDRGFRVGDVLTLAEWNPDTGCYTGECMDVRVTYMHSGGRWFLESDVVVMSIEPYAIPARAAEMPGAAAGIAFNKGDLVRLTRKIAALAPVGSTGEVVLAWPATAKRGPEYCVHVIGYPDFVTDADHLEPFDPATRTPSVAIDDGPLLYDIPAIAPGSEPASACVNCDTETDEQHSWQTCARILAHRCKLLDERIHDPSAVREFLRSIGEESGHSSGATRESVLLDAIERMTPEQRSAFTACAPTPFAVGTNFTNPERERILMGVAVLYGIAPIVKAPPPEAATAPEKKT